jgi:EAL domain-containing protein (putative c-di-GMP-specific phosphodiesterase class I)
VHTHDSLITGVEALLRWTHPERGPVSALSMVAIAEESSLILDIGAWILRRACEDRMTWLREVPDRPLDVSVNVSVRQLLGRGFRDTVVGVLKSTGLPPEALTLEVTEGIFLDDDGRALTVLAELRALGVRIALDDFGTGYSSLSYLRRFPVDIVKIDKGFVAEIARDPTSCAIIAAVTDLAHVLGLSVTAEGVETLAQHEQIVAVGCDSAQGFHYARPLSVDDLTVSLQTGRLDPFGRRNGQAVLERGR